MRSYACDAWKRASHPRTRRSPTMTDATPRRSAWTLQGHGGVAARRQPVNVADPVLRRVVIAASPVGYSWSPVPTWLLLFGAALSGIRPMRSWMEAMNRWIEAGVADPRSRVVLLALAAMAVGIAAVLLASAAMRTLSVILSTWTWKSIGAREIRRRVRAAGLDRGQRRALYDSFRNRALPFQRSVAPWRVRTTVGSMIVLCNQSWTYEVQHDVVSHEGEWLVRCGVKRAIESAEVLFLLLALCGIASVAFFRFDMPPTMWPSTALWAAVTVAALGRFSVACGFLPRGWFDAWIDPDAIEFAGPFRSTRFPREDTCVLITIFGPGANVTLRRRDGKTARLFLTHRGASILGQVWSAPARISRAA